MRNLKYKCIVLIFIVFGGISNAYALDIQYGTILGTKGSTFLVQYYGIGKKQNFICSVTSNICTKTKKTNLGTPPSSKISESVQSELQTKNASHITVSPSATMVAYYIGGDYLHPQRVYTLRNLTTNKEVTVSDSVSYWDLVNDSARVFAFSPDEKKLIYLDDKDGTLSLYSTNTQGNSDGTITSTKLKTTAYQVCDFIFTDANTLYYTGNTKENPYVWSLYSYNLKTNSQKVLAKNISYQDPLRHIGSAIVFNQLQAKGYGPALYTIATQKVHEFSIPNIDTKNTIAHEEVIESGDVHGVLMTPTKIKASKKYPLLIWLHGGPYRETSLMYHPLHSYGIYDSILELLRKNNVIVLKLDYPGSFGYGRQYAEGIQSAVGKTDVAEVMDALTYIKNRYPNIDSSYLAGNSYGGYLSLKTLVEHPSDFTGVVSINGVTDWASLLEKLKTSIFNTHFNGLPNPSNQALYDQASILNKIPNLTEQKIEIIQGQSDRTIDPAQAELLYTALIQQQKNVSIVRYPNEDHVFREKKTISDLCVQLFHFTGTPVDSGCSK